MIKYWNNLKKQNSDITKKKKKIQAPVGKMRVKHNYTFYKEAMEQNEIKYEQEENGKNLTENV